MDIVILRAVCVTDMARAIRFYEALLERPVKKRDKTYSVSGGRLPPGAVHFTLQGRALEQDVLPSLELPCRAALVRKLAGQKVVFPLRRPGPNWVSEIEDSEGNRLELTAPAEKDAQQKGGQAQMDICAYWRAALQKDAAAMRPCFCQKCP